MLYVAYTINIANGGDIINYFNDGNIIYKQLFINPYHYFKLVFFPNNVEFPLDVKPVIFEMGFWHETSAYMLVRFNSLIRIISFGNIYIHSLFSGLFSFIGSFMIYKVFEKHLKASYIVFFSIFFFPSILFWTAGLHKEFISTFALGLILYHFFKLFEYKNKAKHLLFFSIGVILFFLTRNYMLLALIPSLLAYSIHKIFNFSFKKLIIICISTLLFLMNFVKLPSYNKTGFEVIIEKRMQFLDLKNGNTSIVLDEIEPSFLSLFKNSPKALFNTILRPHFGEIKTSFLLLSSVESTCILLLIFLAILNLKYLNQKESDLIVFMLLYSFLLLLIIGWIVPNIGAIIRYRSISLILLIPSLIFIISKNKKISSFMNFETSS